MKYSRKNRGNNEISSHSYTLHTLTDEKNITKCLSITVASIVVAK